MLSIIGSFTNSGGERRENGRGTAMLIQNEHERPAPGAHEQSAQSGAGGA
jgi:hypothetical protein